MKRLSSLPDSEPRNLKEGAVIAGSRLPASIAAAMTLLLTGCNRESLSIPDASVPDAPVDCTALATILQSLLGAATGCAQDEDCQFVVAFCCGAVANKSANLSKVAGLQAALQTENCPQIHCIDCDTFPTHPYCDGQACSLRLPTLEEGAVGQPCERSGDCYDGACLADYPGGYCSMLCGNGYPPCPAGSSCRMPVEGGSACLKDCGGSTGGTCRSGYSCCSSPPSDAGTGSCALPSSPFC